MLLASEDIKQKQNERTNERLEDQSSDHAFVRLRIIIIAVLDRELMTFCTPCPVGL